MNQFIARNGIISKRDLIVTGSLTSTNGFTGSFSGSTSAPGLTTQVTYNNNGVLSADSGFVYSGSNVVIGGAGRLGIGGNLGTSVDVSKTSNNIITNYTQTVEGNAIAISSNSATGHYLPGLVWYSPFSNPTKPRIGIFGELTPEGSKLYLGTSNVYATGITNQVVINSLGNVGIGTTSPTSRLQVKGSGTTSSTTALLVQNANATASMVVLDNGNVGIGIAAPLKPLHINTNNNDAALSFRISNDNAGGRAGLTFNLPNNTNQNWSIGASDTRAFVIADGVSLQSNPSLTIIPGGNVGIGTTAPAAKLDVIGGTRIGNGTITLGLGESSGDSVFVGSVTNHPLKFVTNTLEHMRILTSGNVGIGTTTPSTKLHVSGAVGDGIILNGIGSVGMLIQAGGLAGGSGTVQLFAGNNNNSYLRLASEYIREGAGGGLGVNVSRENITAKFQVRGSGTTSATTAFRVENSNASASLIIYDDNRTELTQNTGYNSTITDGALVLRNPNNLSAALGVTSDGILRVKLNTGWGINFTAGSDQTLIQGNRIFSFNTALRIGGNLSNSTSATNSSVLISDTITMINSAHRYNALSITTPASSSITNGLVRGLFINPTFSGSVDYRSIETTAGDILFQSGSSPLFFVSQSGNVSIGTSNPTYKLDVSGSGNFTDNLTVTGSFTAVVNVISPRFQSLTNVNTYVSLAGGGGAFIDFRANNSPIVRMSSNGMFVGGDTTPSSRLQVKGSGVSTLKTFLVEDSNSKSNFVVLDNGRVGINIADPTQTGLSISGSINIFDGLINISATAVNPFGVDYGYKQGQYIGLGGTRGTQSTILGNSVFPGSGSSTVRHISGDVGSYIRLGIGSGITFHTNITSSLNVDIAETSNEVFRVTQTGNVGIGTSSPTQKLDVNGSIRVRSGFGYTSDFSGGVFGISILNVDGSDNIVIGSTYSPKNVILTSGIRYDFASTGLGINVTSPTARLHIRGSGTTSATTALLVQNANASTSLTVKDDLTTAFGGDLFTANNSVISGSFGYSGGDFIRIHGLNTNGQAKIASYDYGSTRTTELAFGSGLIHWQGLYKFSTNGYYLTDGVGSIASYERLTIDYLGRVGISNPNPSYRLDISGSGNFTSNLTVTGSLIVSGSSTLTNIGPAIFSGSITQTASTASFGGLVGIGTTTPSASLDIFKNNTGNIQNNNDSVIIKGNNPRLKLLGTSAGSSTGDGVIQFSTQDSGDRWVITAGGTFSIGAGWYNSNTSLFRITNSSGGNTAASIFLANADNDGRFSLGFSGTNGTPLSGFTGTGKLYISSTGLASPIAMLHVKGSGTTSATTAFRVENANATSSMVVLDNGNVGIGGDAMAASYKLRVYGSLWADSLDQLISLNGSAGVGRIQYYNAGATLLMRVYGPHPSEGVKGILTLDRQDLNYVSLANSIPHSASFYMDHPSFVIRSNDTSANSFYLQNYMHASGALFVTNQPAGGDTSFRFRPSASITGSTDVFVINTEGVQVIGSASISGSARIDEVLTLTPLDPLPTGSPTGSFAVSASVPPIPYFYDGTTWNALY